MTRHICEPCSRGDHHRCSEAGVCQCTINPDTGEDEGVYCDLCAALAVWSDDRATVFLCAEHRAAATTADTSIGPAENEPDPV